ncbi:hypothetical protein ACH42_17235 [Endozoicomonas sp. (ex Bugula neritina AB1)]|nr:hypothetical protein ACH42_17235 [Endozoicomonas sp. (ex Bugula neritina AB1)]
MNYFFGRLKKIYGPNYKIRYVKESDENIAKKEWWDHITPLGKQQMDAGFLRLQEMMTSNPDRWRWPEIAGTISLCLPKPEDFNMPTYERAWHEVSQHCHEPLDYNWPHRGVYLAGHYTGWFALRNTEDKVELRKLKEKFVEEYHRVIMRKFMTGHVEPQQALTHEGAELSLQEKTKRHHEQSLKTTMNQQGINPHGGRREYLQRLKDIGIIKEQI